MSKMIDYLKASAGEASLLTRLGFWRQAVSLTVDQLVDLVQLISGGANYAQVGGTTRALSADVPYIEVASNAAIIAGMNGTLGP